MSSGRSMVTETLMGRQSSFGASDEPAVWGCLRYPRSMLGSDSEAARVEERWTELVVTRGVARGR